MKVTYYGSWFLAICTLQTTLFNYIKIFGIKPNLFIIFIITIAILKGYREGGVIGLITGLLIDFMSGKIIGVNALLGMYIGMCIGFITRNFIAYKPLIVILTTIISTFIYEFIFYLISFLMWGETQTAFTLLNIILPETIYTAFISIPVFYLIKKTMYPCAKNNIE